MSKPKKEKKEMRAYYMPWNGEKKEIFPDKGKEVFSLEQLQTLVEGRIEIVDLQDEEGNGPELIINEEGKLEGLPVNIEATMLYEKKYGRSNSDIIVGNVVLVENYNWEK